MRAIAIRIRLRRKMRANIMIAIEIDRRIRKMSQVSLNAKYVSKLVVKAICVRL